MRQLLAIGPNFAVAPSRALAALTCIALVAPWEPGPAQALPSGVLHASVCDVEDMRTYTVDLSLGSDVSCSTPARPTAELADARAYLIETASLGYTMTRQGRQLAIERLHPEFAIRLADALREARESGLPDAGIFSAYRPPAFGVGGFSDKFNSLHAYGLAVDLAGIGGPGSAEAQRWHEIAARHGVICPYGAHNSAEWNHCQPTSLKIVMADNPLRETITAEGPRSLDEMFEAGNALVESPAGAAGAVGKELPVHATAQASVAVKAKRRPPRVREDDEDDDEDRHKHKRNGRVAERRAADKEL
jgi:hypothetical protein